jgi:hypothetical protein
LEARVPESEPEEEVLGYVDAWSDKKKLFILSCLYHT